MCYFLFSAAQLLSSSHSAYPHPHSKLCCPKSKFYFNVCFWWCLPILKPSMRYIKLRNKQQTCHAHSPGYTWLDHKWQQEWDLCRTGRIIRAVLSYYRCCYLNWNCKKTPLQLRQALIMLLINVLLERSMTNIWYLSFWYLLPRRLLPLGSLPAIIFSVMLSFSWETRLPWNKEPDGSAAPHSPLGLVEMNSWVAEEKGFELLYPALQALGKIMSNFFGLLCLILQRMFSRISFFTHDEFSDPSFGK